MEHIWLGCELDLVAASQKISDQKNALREFFIPIVSNSVTDDCTLDVPARPSGNVTVKVSNGRDVTWIEFQRGQAILKFLANMFQQIWLVNTCIEVCPNRMLFVGEIDFLIFGRIFALWINVLFSNIACIGRRLLICGHNLALSQNWLLDNTKH